MHLSKQEKTAVVAVAVNSLLTGLKFALAWITQSIALKAEAIHSFSDVFSSMAVLWASRKDRKDGLKETAEGEEKASRRWFVRGAWESRIAIGIGIFLILMSINVFSQTRGAIVFEIRRPLLAACLMAFLSLLSYLLSRLEIHVGEESDSSALVADGYHARVDMVVSLFVALVLFGVRYGYKFDKPGAVIIALFILVNGIQALLKGISCYWNRHKTQCATEEGIFVFENLLVELVRNGLRRARDGARTIPVPKAARIVLGSKRNLLCIIVVVSALVYCRSGFFVLSPSQEAIVELFGVPQQEQEPLQAGLHFAWPRPFSRARIVDTGTIRRLDMNYQVRRDQPDFILWTNVHYMAENAILTGEGSFLDMALVVHYQVSDLKDYLYENGDPESLLKACCQAAIRHEIGTRRFFDTMTSDRQLLESVFRGRLQEDSDRFRLGLKIVGVCLLDMHPPLDVATAFEDVVSAQEDYETYIEEAKGYGMDLIPRARATASRTVSEATGTKALVVNRSIGAGEAFIKRLTQYETSREITEKRLFLEKMEETLAGVPMYIVPGSGAMPRLWSWKMPWTNAPVTGDAGAGPADSSEAEEGLKRGRITSEDDLIDAMQKMRMGREQ